MVAATKAITYTKAIEEDLYITYGENPTPETVKLLAEKHNKPERSIISKLSAMGIYRKKVYLSKGGAKPVRKEDLITNISELLEIDPTLLESLEKVTKYALVIIEQRVKAILELE